MRIAAAYRMFAHSFGGAAARTRKVVKGRGARGQEGKSCALRTSSSNAASDMGVGLLRMFLFDMRMAAGFGDPCLCGRLPQRTGPQCQGAGVTSSPTRGSSWTGSCRSSSFMLSDAEAVHVRSISRRVLALSHVTLSFFGPSYSSPKSSLKRHQGGEFHCQSRKAATMLEK